MIGGELTVDGAAIALGLAAIGHLSKTIYEMSRQYRSTNHREEKPPNGRVDQVVRQLADIAQMQARTSHETALILQRLELRQETATQKLDHLISMHEILRGGVKE